MKKKTTILIIDDNAELVGALEDFLQKQAFRVLSAFNGLEGLKRLEVEDGQVGLIITDLVMPYISGVGVITIAKKKFPDTPVIAITAWGEYPEALAAEARADVVIKKPFDIWTLNKWIHHLLGSTAGPRPEASP